MKKEEIMKRAIAKALNNGLDPEYLNEYPVQELIWQHDFAKALWGEENIKDHDDFLENEFGTGEHDVCPTQAAWAYHLTKMVLEEDPILYLEKYL